jgi:hypothetical protein
MGSSYATTLGTRVGHMTRPGAALDDKTHRPHTKVTKIELPKV